MTYPQPLPWTEAPVSSARLAKALLCVVRTDAPGIYRVFSPSGEAYGVQTIALDMPLCDCADAIFRDCLCAHAIAALIHARSPRILRALAAWHRTQVATVPESLLV